MSEANVTAFPGSPALQSAALADYIRLRQLQGHLVLPAGSRTFWEGRHLRSLVLRPEFMLDVPAEAEIRSLLWRAWAPLATYACAPTVNRLQNAWLYVCADPDYHMDKLKRSVRKNIRRAQQSLRFEFLDDETLLKHGAKAFCDTRIRVGLSDGTVPAFQQMYAAYAANPGRAVLGAWAGDQLAGFVTLFLVDDWAEIYIYAATDHLILRPVNGLVHYVFDYFLVQRKFRLVSLGVSSIQEESNAVGLHVFKKQVGCECRPVHRGVVFHPLLAPLANSASLSVLRACRRLRPGNVTLRKATGMLACYLGANPMPQDTCKPGEP